MVLLSRFSRPARLHLLLATLLLLAVAGAAVAAPVAEHFVDVGGADNVFTPASITVQVGDTVTWNNIGGYHNVEADDGSFGNDPSPTAWSYSHTFTAPGTYTYFCAPHQAEGMVGEVIVQGEGTMHHLYLSLITDTRGAGAAGAP